MSQITAAQVAGMMDISLLQPQFTRADIDVLIDQAIAYKMASVCAKGYDVAYCAKRLQGRLPPWQQHHEDEGGGGHRQH